MNTINMRVSKLTVDDVEELNSSSTLYLVDFRATGETLTHEIESMFVYENLSQWLKSMKNKHTNGFYVVNSNTIQREDIIDTDLVVAAPSKKASTALADRIGNIPHEATSLWVGVPHPASDKLASTHNLRLNYQYSDFLKKNNKLTQKVLLGDLTPRYFEIKTADDLDRALRQTSGFIKSSLGAGGFSVFSVNKDAATINKKRDKILSTDEEWYFEALAEGLPKSVQLHKTGNKYTLFGCAEQEIEGVNYIGAKLLDVDQEGDERLKTAISQACQRLSPLLSDYEGFFGIDFIDNGDTISILEFNIRLTATTIPTLLANASGKHKAVYYLEERQMDKIDDSDAVLSLSRNGAEVNVLHFVDEQKMEVGDNAFLQFSGCKTLLSKIDRDTIDQVKEVVEKRVSAVVAEQHVNFWPYGWTLSFVLAESHCVISSWQQQRNVFVDIFCCSGIDLEGIVSDLSRLFEGRLVVKEVSRRSVR
jgi:hypothetical protein